MLKSKSYGKGPQLLHFYLFLVSFLIPVWWAWDWHQSQSTSQFVNWVDEHNLKSFWNCGAMAACLLAAGFFKAAAGFRSRFACPIKDWHCHRSHRCHTPSRLSLAWRDHLPGPGNVNTSSWNTESNGEVLCLLAPLQIPCRRATIVLVCSVFFCSWMTGNIQVKTHMQNHDILEIKIWYVCWNKIFRTVLWILWLVQLGILCRRATIVLWSSLFCFFFAVETWLAIFKSKRKCKTMINQKSMHDMVVYMNYFERSPLNPLAGSASDSVSKSDHRPGLFCFFLQLNDWQYSSQNAHAKPWYIRNQDMICLLKKIFRTVLWILWLVHLGVWFGRVTIVLVASGKSNL